MITRLIPHGHQQSHEYQVERDHLAHGWQRVGVLGEMFGHLESTLLVLVSLVLVEIVVRTSTMKKKKVVMVGFEVSIFVSSQNE